MTPENIKNKRLFCLFILGCSLFNYPIISLFNHEILIFGVPLLFVFLFFSWVLIIIAMVAITRMHPKTQHKEAHASKPHDKEPGFPYNSNQGPPC
jgi:uncharacterized BrkB/YihY/UPF0761 family membrane protein